jgi:tRNA pseudouridine32 synthase/23S rRNA pseudouridine746 synthase
MVILHADDALIVASKPAGLPAVPGRADGLQDCFAARIAAQWPDALVVHRLDMATSGLMLFARGKAAQRALSIAFAERRVHKRYVAVVDGVLPLDGAWRTIELPLMADWPNRPRQKVDLVDGKPSVTRYRAVAHEALGTRVALEPVTGRSHQLRVHLMAIGCSIVGDPLYGTAADGLQARLLLHACEVEVVHPVSGRVVRFEEAAPF